MTAIGGKADIARGDRGQEKPSTWLGSQFFGSEAGFALAANAAQLVLAPLPMLRIGAPAAEPASLQVQTFSISK